MPGFCRKKAIIVIFIGVVLSLTAFGSYIVAAGRGEDAFQRAAALYQGGDYSGAAQAYEAMIRNGQASGAVYYNLGNCYFKIGDLGRAILQYERARRLIPADPALRANYAYALKTAEVDNAPRSFPDKVYAAVTGIVQVKALVVLAWIFFLALLLILNLRLLLRHLTLGGRAPGGAWSVRLRQASAVLAVSCAVLIIFSVWAVCLQDLRQQGVIVAGEAAVRYEPNTAGTVFFNLKEGSMVEMGRRNGGWILVERPDGRKGWVEEKSVERI